MAKKELDRFDTHAKKDISLQAKLIALVGGFILLVHRFLNSNINMKFRILPDFF